MTKKTAEQQFWEKVNKTDTCWLWTAALDTQGYGRFWYNGRLTGAHQFSYEYFVAPIDPGLDLDHLVTCPRNCVNYEHLRQATRSQNQQNRLGPLVNSQSRVRGVYWDKARNKWHVCARLDGKTYHGGRFSTLEEANEVAIALRNKLFTHNDLDRGGRCVR